MAACGTKGLAALIPCVCTNCRIWEAEASACPCTWPVWAVPWAAPRRGRGSNCMAAPCRRMALQYSIPKMLLGVCSKSAAPGHNVSAAAARAAAKGRPLSSWLRSAAGNAALHSAAAAACKGAGSGVSAPNARVSHPSAASRCTPAAANCSALALA